MIDRHYEGLLNSIVRRRPRIAAFSLYAWNIAICHQLAAAIKRICPEVLLVAGGPEVFVRPQFVAQFPLFDVAIEGDGELPLRALLGQLCQPDPQLGAIPNSSWRAADGGFVHNPNTTAVEDINALPNYYEDHVELLNHEALYMTSRGCTHQCTYCLWAKQGLRFRSRTKVLQELETIILRGSTQHISLWDYDLVEIDRRDPALLQSMLELFRKKPGITVEFFANTGSLLQPRLRQILADFNVISVNVGLQSMSRHALAAAGRIWSADSIQELFEVDRELRRYLVIELIYPLPGETLDSYVQGLESLIAQGYFRFYMFPLMILRGSGLHRSANALGLQYLSEPPYYCYATPTVTAADYLDMGAVACVLSILGGACRSPRALDQAQSWFHHHLDVVQTILERVRAGVALDRIAGDVISSAFELPTQARFSIGFDLLPSFRAINSPTSQPAARSDSSRMQPAHLPAFVDPIRHRFMQAGVQVLGVEARDQETRFHLVWRNRPFVCFVMPRDDPQPSYGMTRRYKVGYSGDIPDVRWMDRLLGWLREIDEPTS